MKLLMKFEDHLARGFWLCQATPDFVPFTSAFSVLQNAQRRDNRKIIRKPPPGLPLILSPAVRADLLPVITFNADFGAAGEFPSR
jgi:hypothetical protein